MTMEKEDLIPANDFCSYHHISYSFINGLSEAGLVEIAVFDDQQYIRQDQLKDLEKLVHFHNDLDINLEGVEAIAHLLKRMQELQHHMKQLQQRLNIYER